MAKKEDVWDEIKLSGTQKYLKEQYPNLDIEYKVIDRDNQLEVILEEFVEEHKIDMIAMSSSRRGLFTRIFNPGIARRMLFHSDTPLLVIKGLWFFEENQTKEKVRTSEVFGLFFDEVSVFSILYSDKNIWILSLYFCSHKAFKKSLFPLIFL